MVRKKKKKSSYCSKKEQILNELCSTFQESGYVIRREKLYSGANWKALSGKCRLEEQNLILVDRSIPQDEQIAFLVGEALQLNLPLDPKFLKTKDSSSEKAA